MEWVAERAAGSHTEEGGRGRRDGGEGPVGSGSVGGTPTWQTQKVRVRNTYVHWGLFLPSSLTKYQTDRNKWWLHTVMMVQVRVGDEDPIPPNPLEQPVERSPFLWRGSPYKPG
jgi:hypothetical protein